LIMSASARLRGLLLGQAMGDSIGLPMEGLTAAAIHRRWPEPLEQSLLLGRGWISDDTEHACLTLVACLRANGDGTRFERALAWQLRWWFACLPGGVGLATARSCLKLWLGFPPRPAGSYSAGNGPCMRATVLGAVFSADEVTRHDWVRVSTRLTHTDPRAEIAAQALADAVAWVCSGRPKDGFLAHLRAKPADAEWIRQLEHMQTLAQQGADLAHACAALCGPRGVSGYAYQTVPAVLYAWLHGQGSPRERVEALIRCGGDTDTAAALLGALLGAEGGEDIWPLSWVERLAEWPRSRGYLARLAEAAARGSRPPAWFWPAQPVRNVLFLLVVIGHGLLRPVLGRRN
jgi:ADP-ribosyl-[dinitrogen reductase] hydrolase